MQTNLPIRSITDYIFSHSLTTAPHGRIDSMATRGIQGIYISVFFVTIGGRRSPAVACWASDHWVASSNPLRGKFRH